MKQLLILSGKGGTGKTTIASAFIKLAKPEAYADCDVDAPNLHLVQSQENIANQTNFYGMPKAEIDPNQCVYCGFCKKYCRFDAIKADEFYEVDRLSCEGCGVCELICPVGAISLKPAKAGDLMLYKDDDVFSTAQLTMGSGNSGLLVSEVKKQMEAHAPKAKLAIIDGSPGIGCPVISSISGVDMVLIVAEPSLSGISDMERIIKTASSFQPEVAVCVNKYDINVINTKEIELICETKNIRFVGAIPFDITANRAVNAGQSIVDIDCDAGQATKQVFNKVMKMLMKEGLEQDYDHKNSDRKHFHLR
ncbi:ATP-binding protein [Bacillus marasmi]|uniref:ATP-binding protein n=1 Tax=Bacillus marasmi TaxID=1926279 RepID=UPI0011C8D40D|nr:ATP-binding protein [Bacillus marasmi]